MPKKGELKPIPHGTYGGTQQHRKRGIPIDDEDSCGCRKAHREYMAAWRQRSRVWKKRDKLNSRIRTRVGAWLMASHPEEAKRLRVKARQEVIAEMKREALKDV